MDLGLRESSSAQGRADISSVGMTCNACRPGPRRMGDVARVVAEVHVVVLIFFGEVESESHVLYANQFRDVNNVIDQRFERGLRRPGQEKRHGGRSLAFLARSSE